MKKFSCLLLTFLLLATEANSQNIESLKSLLGEWVAKGGGAPGQGSGTFTFQYDLDKKVMTRKSESEYPAWGNKPAIVHKDLMVIYTLNDSLRAIYFDNEGHSIAYSVSFQNNGKLIQFNSDLTPGTMGFRLTYEVTKADTMNVGFDISPDGLPEHFRPYVKGVSHRKK
jgi:hypothetical protein